VTRWRSGRVRSPERPGGQLCVASRRTAPSRRGLAGHRSFSPITRSGPAPLLHTVARSVEGLPSGWPSHSLPSFRLRHAHVAQHRQHVTGVPFSRSRLAPVGVVARHSRRGSHGTRAFPGRGPRHRPRCSSAPFDWMHSATLHRASHFFDTRSPCQSAVRRHRSTPGSTTQSASRSNGTVPYRTVTPSVSVRPAFAPVC